MKSRRIRSFLVVLVLLSMTSQFVFAEDGILFRRNISKTPDQETERANLNHMSFYVPAQSSDGTVLTEGIEYYIGEDADTQTLYDTRYYAKPLVAVYIDSLPEEPEEEEGIYSILSGAGFGAHDAYGAVSLDDGETWKRTNLSMSADLSSFTLADGHPYPGDAHNMTFAIAGDKVLIGWISKYCDGGSPSYTFTDDEIEALQTSFGLPDLYVRDIWGVAGNQSSVNYTLQGFPEVGEIPYSCVWSARGQLLEVDAEGVPTVDGGFYDIVWTKAERLTSGRRDANRLEMNGDGAAGFMMTWQEDPEGLRPGMGLGPGEGWSGAVVNQQTDLWYSYISITDFVKVWTTADKTEAVPLSEYIGEEMPKIAVPMAMPLRLTDNKKCMVAKGAENTEAQQFPYCYVDFDVLDENGNVDLPVVLPIAPSLDSDFCATQVSWTNPGGTILQLCQAEDGRVLGGRVGASRPRVNVQPYDSSDDGIARYDSAIVIMGAEESKALGEGSVDDIDGDEIIEPEDIGKNMWYYSFDLLNPEFVLQGGMLNQPAVCGPQDEDCTLGEFFPLLEDDFGNQFYETEIARRFAHFSQPIHQIGDSGIAATLIVKQGIIKQGGPADIFLRFLRVPDDNDKWLTCETDGDATTTERCLLPGYNPYAYENLVCEDLDGNSMWAYTDDTNGGHNPRYMQGLCLSDMVNVSSATIVACDNGTSGEDCAAAFPWDGVEDGATYPKVIEWEQSGPNYGDTVDETNIGILDDQSWENPYDVAKGHRGFIDGDYIMMMYAWSPNWQANSVGHDHYNLYARRSFDGGKTWTTTPAEFGGEGETGYTAPDGTALESDPTACENYKDALGDIKTVCYDYAAGDFEQARNLSQLIGNKVTILDPRYSPTGGIKMLPITDFKGIGFTGYEDDTRDRSKFFIVYETGDNTTVAEGEAVPLDLFYSRATNYGDDYDLVPYVNSTDGTTTYGFDWLEHDREDLSGEAANTCNNAGTMYYIIWNQWQEDEEENVSNSDAIFRRILYVADDDTTELRPIASILYTSATMVSQSADDVLTLTGTARDLDVVGEGIVAYKWTSSLDGEVGNDQVLTIPAADLSRGRHTITFTALDGEGQWAAGKSVTIVVAETVHRVMLPMVMGNN